MTDFTPTPVAVSDTPDQAAIATSVRNLALAASSIATALGMTHLGTTIGTLGALAGPAAMVIVLAYQYLHSKSKQAKLIVAANAAPNSVAVVTGQAAASVAK